MFYVATHFPIHDGFNYETFNIQLDLYYISSLLDVFTAYAIRFAWTGLENKSHLEAISFW